MKYGGVVVEEVLRGVKLPDLPLVQHHDLVVVEDRVEPVGDGQHRTTLELLPDGGLDEVVRLQVDGGSGLVQDEHLGLAQERPAQTEQLSLAHAQVLAALTDLVVEALVERGRPLLQMGQL